MKQILKGQFWIMLTYFLCVKFFLCFSEMTKLLLPIHKTRHSLFYKFKHDQTFR